MKRRQLRIDVAIPRSSARYQNINPGLRTPSSGRKEGRMKSSRNDGNGYSLELLAAEHQAVKRLGHLHVNIRAMTAVSTVLVGEG